MTDPEILNWLKVLSNSKKRQRAIVVDLLHHAREDGMSVRDLEDCRRALDLLSVKENANSVAI